MLDNYTQLQAFKLIELSILWEDKLQVQDMINHFGISRQSATNYMSSYKELHPENIIYDKGKKYYLPNKKIKPYYSSGSLNEYINLSQGQLQTEDSVLPSDSQFFYMGSSLQQPEAKIISKIIRAIKQKERVDISYVSVSGSGLEERIISPHSLINDGRRWHARAWCESSQDFRDFVLTRVRKVYDNEGKAEKLREHDSKWNAWINFSIEPDPRLSISRQEVVAMDYSMKKNKEGKYERRYKVREALIIYWLQQLRLDIYRDAPEAQQIVLCEESRPALAQYLPQP